MSDESLSMASMNWRLVEDAKEAMSRDDWMLALSLFEQSRRICINEGWREGVHYADDMILNIYPMVKRQIDESNKMPEKKPDGDANSLESSMIHQQHEYSRTKPLPGKDGADDDNRDQENGTAVAEGTMQRKNAFDENPANRRLRRMMSDGRGNRD